MNDPRPQDVPYPIEEHVNRLMCSDPVACAYAWIEGYAANLSSDRDDDDEYYGTVTAPELIDTALENIESNSDYADSYISKGGLLEGVSTDGMFWDKLAILKGIEIPDNKRNSFFSCSC